MFDPTDTRTSDMRRLLALIPVAALALIFVNVFVSLRATAAPRMSSAPSTSAEAEAVAAPWAPELIATTPDEVARMEAAGLVHPVAPARSASTASEMERLAQLDALLYAPVVPLEQLSNDTLSDSQWQQACLEVEGWRGNPPLLAACVQRGLSVDTLYR